MIVSVMFRIAFEFCNFVSRWTKNVTKLFVYTRILLLKDFNNEFFELVTTSSLYYKLLFYELPVGSNLTNTVILFFKTNIG